MVRPVATERFVLEPLGPWRAFRLSFPWTRDAELMRTYTQSSARRSAWKWFREMARPNGRTRFAHAIRPHGAEAPIGIHFVRIKPHRSAYLSVIVADRAWWGKRVVEEVRAALIDHILAHAPVDRISAQVEARNFPSVFNYRKLGFAHVGTLHRAKADPATGEVYDLLIFELMRENWKKSGEGTDG